MIHYYGMRLGIESFLKGRITREAIKNVIVPANYWRTLEYRLTFDALSATPADRILDVGSPKLLSFYLADRVGAEVYSTDIEDYFVPDYVAFRSMRKIPESRFRPLRADGRQLPFPDSHFTRAYAISVLEHVPGTGDADCMRELARTLAPGGICALTVPFSPKSRDEFKRPKEFYWSQASVESGNPSMVFYQRRYSENDLETRLVLPSGMRLKKLLYLGDRLPLKDGREVPSRGRCIRSCPNCFTARLRIHGRR